MSERRRYFRIDDEFEVRVLPSNGGPRPRAEVAAFASETRELGRALMQLRKKLPEAADVIELLARRVAVLERQGDDADEIAPAEMVQGTNISGCGIAICSRHDLAPGRLLELELHLDAGAVRLQAAGRVVSSESLAQRNRTARVPVAGEPAALKPSSREWGWLVRIDFVDIDAGDEETLVQYVMRRQLRQLRRGRDAEGART